MSLSKTPSRFIQYLITFLLSFFILELLIQLHEVRWHIPFHYTSGDSFASIQVVKSVLDTGNYLTNRYIGAPGVHEYYDFPRTDHVHIYASALLGLLRNDYAFGTNLYFCLTFPFTAMAALAVFRYLKVRFLPALCFSILYAFLPYHFIRAQAHFYLAAYYVVPLEVLIMLWIFRREKFMMSGRMLPSRKGWAVLAITALTASSGTYYSFFGCFLLTIAGLYTAYQKSSWTPLRAAVISAALIVLFSLINLSPFILYSLDHGKNPDVAKRHFMEADTFGLRLAGLLLPAGGHRISWLSEKISQYPTSILNENRSAYLGVAGVIGFAILLWHLFFVRAKEAELEISFLSALNGSSLLLALPGGFGPLFAFLFYEQFRAYNRISVFIAFFSLLAAGLILNRALERLSVQSKNIFAAVLIAMILIAGLLDQTLPAYRVYKPNQVNEFESDALFVKQIEKLVPQDSMIFQLPYQPFPEVRAPFRMIDYDHFRGYLHSQKLRWSYGAMRGRDVNEWQSRVAQLQPEEMISELKKAGFKGIYFDRNGFPRGGGYEDQLKEILGRADIVSANRRLLFFKF